MKPSSRKTSFWQKRVNRLNLALGASLWSLFGALCLVTLAACAPSQEGQRASEYQIPWPTEKAGAYKLQRVRIESFTAPESLQGRFVRLMVNPYLENGQLKSAAPIGRFVQNDDGVWVPSDYASLQAAAIHAHYERLVKMDRTLGLSQNIQYPVRVGIRANVKDKKGAVKNNAIFDQRLDALLIVPYSKNRLPIAINAGVLAHEHFHRIFQQTVLNRLGEKQPVIAEKPQSEPQTESKTEPQSGLCDWTTHALHSSENTAGVAAQLPEERARINLKARYDENSPEMTPEIFNSFLLRGINEGLADYWGWVYTGDPGFIEPSLPEIGWSRRLDTDLVINGLAGVPSVKNLMKDPANPGKILPENLRYQRAYEVGTRYARFLRDLTLSVSPSADDNFDARLAVAQIVASSLSDFTEVALAAKHGHQFLSPNAILKPLSEKIPQAAQFAACKVINDVSAEEEGGRRPKFCESSAVPTAGDPDLESPAPQPTSPGGPI